MNRLPATVAIAAIVLAGCGSPSHPRTAPTRVCQPRHPATLGECLRQEYGARPPKPTLSLSFGGQCIDISVYQGVPDFRAARRAGLRCAVVQANDGGFRNSRFYEQVSALRSAGVPFGVYTFLENQDGESQANTATSMGRGQGVTLGYWADAEVNGAYQHACAYVNAARHSSTIVGVYSSPGLYAGAHCQGYLWPAEWGGGGAYPFAGYSYSSIKLRQFCGTCYFAGVSGQVDRDEDRGLLALLAPAAPTHAELQLRLYREYRRRGGDRIYILRHQCAYGRHRHALPHGKDGRRKCNRVLKDGRQAGVAITALHREGAR